MNDTSGSNGEGKVQLSSLAKADLDAIAITSLEKFGLAQAQTYIDELWRTLTLLAIFPQMGTDQSHLKASVRRHVHGAHVIYYRLNKEGIRVLRLLGPGRDPVREFLE